MARYKFLNLDVKVFIAIILNKIISFWFYVFGIIKNRIICSLVAYDKILKLLFVHF